jgi:hypothetical protein
VKTPSATRTELRWRWPAGGLHYSSIILATMLSACATPTVACKHFVHWYGLSEEEAQKNCAHRFAPVLSDEAMSYVAECQVGSLSPSIYLAFKNGKVVLVTD